MIFHTEPDVSAGTVPSARENDEKLVRSGFRRTSIVLSSNTFSARTASGSAAPSETPANPARKSASWPIGTRAPGTRPTPQPAPGTGRYTARGNATPLTVTSLCAQRSMDWSVTRSCWSAATVYLA